MELEPRSIVLVFRCHLAVVFYHAGNGALLGKHHPYRVKERYVNICEGVWPHFRKACHLSQVIYGLHRVLDKDRVNRERLCNRLANGPFTHPDTEFFKHDPCEVPPFERGCITQHQLDRTHLLFLGGCPAPGRDAYQSGIDLDKVRSWDDNDACDFFARSSSTAFPTSPV